MGATGVLVGGTGVFVGGTRVGVGGAGVSVAGSSLVGDATRSVAVACKVAVGVGVGVLVGVVIGVRVGCAVYVGRPRSVVLMATFSRGALVSMPTSSRPQVTEERTNRTHNQTN